MLKKYLLDKIKLIIAFIVCFFIFYVVNALFLVPLHALWVSFFICIGVGLIVGMVDYNYYSHKIKKLEEIKEDIEKDAQDNLAGLPEVANEAEQRYQELLSNLDHIYQVAKLQNEELKTDVLEVYLLCIKDIKNSLDELGGHIKPEDNLARAEIFSIKNKTDVFLHFLQTYDLHNDMLFESADLEPIIVEAVKKYAPVFLLKKIKFNANQAKYEANTDKKWITFCIEMLFSAMLENAFFGEISVDFNDNSLFITSNAKIKAQKIKDIKDIENNPSEIDIAMFMFEMVINALGHTYELNSDNNSSEMVIKFNKAEDVKSEFREGTEDKEPVLQSE